MSDFTNDLDSAFGFLYKMHKPIKSLPHYKPKEEFSYGKCVSVCKLKGTGDGQTVEVFEERLPARFFTVRVYPGTNSVGKPKAGCEIGTGSGDEMGELAGQLAVAISTGMLSVKPKGGSND